MEKIFILISALFLWSCADCEDHTDTDCSNYIPCLNGEKSPVPSFGVGGRLVLLPTTFHDTIVHYVDLDTVLTGNIRFFPKEDYEDATWIIDDKIYNDDELLKFYDDDWHGRDIEVGMTVYEYQECLSVDDRRGFTFRNVSFYDYEANNPDRTIPIHGDFKGSYTSEIEIFTISVGEKEIENLPEGSTTKALFYQFYDRFFIEGYFPPFSYQYSGEGNLSVDRKTLTIDLQMLENDVIVEKTFVGVRVN